MGYRISLDDRPRVGMSTREFAICHPPSRGLAATEQNRLETDRDRRRQNATSSRRNCKAARPAVARELEKTDREDDNPPRRVSACCTITPRRAKTRKPVLADPGPGRRSDMSVNSCAIGAVTRQPLKLERIGHHSLWDAHPEQTADSTERFVKDSLPRSVARWHHRDQWPRVSKSPPSSGSVSSSR